MTNAELLAAGNRALDAIRVTKALSPTVPTTDSLKAGEFMDRKQVERLVDLTVNQSGWVSECSLKLRNQRSGEMPRANLTDIVTEGVPENGNRTITTHPDTDYIPYECRKFQATWYIDLEDIREAAASGDPDLQATFMQMFGKAMGNDFARAGLRGDTVLDASTRENRLLRQRDGWLKRARAGGHVVNTVRGENFAIDAFFRGLDEMPQIYRDDANLKWFMPSTVDLKWQNILAAYAANASQLGERALTTRERVTPTGVPQLLIPQMPTDQGCDITTTAAVAADTVVDDTDGTITATVDTLLGGALAGNAGRRVKITFTGTGMSETLVVTWEGGANKIHTVGSLGQGTISETEADYTIDLADLTTVFLTNPKNLVIVLCDRVRAYRKFEQEAERWRVDVFYEADFPLFNDDAIVVLDGIIRPTYQWGVQQ